MADSVLIIPFAVLLALLVAFLYKTITLPPELAVPAPPSEPLPELAPPAPPNWRPAPARSGGPHPPRCPQAPPPAGCGRLPGPARPGSGAPPVPTPSLAPPAVGTGRRVGPGEHRPHRRSGRRMAVLPRRRGHRGLLAPGRRSLLAGVCPVHRRPDPRRGYLSGWHHHRPRRALPGPARAARGGSTWGGGPSGTGHDGAPHPGAGLAARSPGWCHTHQQFGDPHLHLHGVTAEDAARYPQPAGRE